MTPAPHRTSRAAKPGASLGLPKGIFAALRRHPPPILVAPLLVESASLPLDGVYQRLESRATGLTTDEAETRLGEHGPNTVGADGGKSIWLLVGHAVINPLVVLLAVLATISFATGDARAGIVMSLMIALGVGLRLFQERRADNAAARLKAMISVTATVLRDGHFQELPIAQLVPGDVVKLAAGDMIPADVRIVSAKDLFVIQGSLTGESFPVEKFDVDHGSPDRSPIELANVAFLGTSVESGTALAVVAATGRQTYLGSMADSLAEQSTETAFDKGVARFTWLMLRFILVMVPLVFLINGLTKGNWHSAFFFAVAVAVGLTPEMLPMIVTVSLSKGALAMARKKVVVKRLNAIQNLGAMDVLCTDKTGTLTMDHVILDSHCDVVLKEDDGVLVLAYLNSYFQTGLKNLLDRAILAHVEMHEHAHIPQVSKLDEIPFDFQRRIMSVVVRTPDGKDRVISKGAPEAIFQRCSAFEVDGDLFPIEHILIHELQEEYEHLSRNGFRVLAIATKVVEPRGDGASYGRDDETDLVLHGYLAFLDPPKDTATAAIRALQQHGVSVKVVTGDNDLVARKVCAEVGLATEHTLLGTHIEGMTDGALAEAAERTTLFARVSPAHKQRIIQALQSRGHTVGFMGDGINDAPALRAADVGISVDTAVDIAKESADLILLEKSLLVLEEGVLEGRKVFANILKYIGMGASSSFGNMFSVLGASIFVPYLPMMPIQILTNNLLYDVSQTAIPTDDVDPEEIARPRPWDIGAIAKFILFIGPCSSVFDYTTFLMMLYVFKAWPMEKAPLFQTGWFVESLLTQTLIIHVIRTRKVPFLESRASWPLIAMTATIMGVGVLIPLSPLGPFLGFTTLPLLYWPLLALTLLAYMLLTQGVKTWLIRRAWV